MALLARWEAPASRWTFQTDVHHMLELKIERTTQETPASRWTSPDGRAPHFGTQGRKDKELKGKKKHLPHVTDRGHACGRQRVDTRTTSTFPSQHHHVKKAIGGSKRRRGISPANIYRGGKARESVIRRREKPWKSALLVLNNSSCSTFDSQDTSNF